MNQSVSTQSFSEFENECILRLIPFNFGNDHLSLQWFLKRDDFYSGFHVQVKPFRKIEKECLDEIQFHEKKYMRSNFKQSMMAFIFKVWLISINNNLSTQNTTFCVCTVPQLRLPL